MLSRDLTFFHEVLDSTGIEHHVERVSEHVVSSALEGEYGLSGQLTRINTEKDDTFRLDSGGQRLLVKVAPAAEDPEIVALQSAAMTHIESRAPHLPTQRIIRGIHDQGDTPLIDASGSERVMRVLSYIDGQLQHEVAATPEQLQRTGGMLAQLDEALADFRHPRESRLLLWDLKIFPEMRHLATYVADDSDRRLAYRVFDSFDKHVTGMLPALAEQAIHGDFSPHNVVVDPASPEFVTGVIDFGDVMRGPVLFELSVPVANQLGVDAADPWASALDVVRGYRRLRDLETDVVELLTWTGPARLLLRALIYNWRSQHDPHSREYAASHSAKDWQRLRAALAVDEDSVRATFAGTRPEHERRTKGMT